MTDDSISIGIGSVVGSRYRIVSLLGEGGMGNVFLAQDEYLKRNVALKFLRDEWGGRPDIQKRLENECRFMAHLGQHPNIVMLLDRIVEGGKTILVMEYAPGETLSQILARTAHMAEITNNEALTRSRPDASPLILKPEITYEVIVQCLKGLDFAHSKGIVHLDIKPSNIMVYRDTTGAITAKLMDFGISRTCTDICQGTAVTAMTFTEHEGMGTPAYMAPEQIDPNRFGSTGPATDIYSLGVTFYEMVTLQLPFSGGYTEVLHAHANTRPPNPRDINPHVPPHVARVIMTAMRKAPGNRYSSASEMLLDLLEEQPARLANPLGTTAGFLDSILEGAMPKRKINVRLRTVLLVVLLGVAGGYFWLNRGLTQFGFSVISSILKGETVSVSEAKAAALTAREEASKVKAVLHAAEAWKEAEALFTRAGSQSNPADAIRLYLLSQEKYHAAEHLAQSGLKETEGEQAPTNMSPAVSSAQEETGTDTASDAVATADESAEQAPESEEPSLPKTKSAPVILTDTVQWDMVWIPPGSFRSDGGNSWSIARRTPRNVQNEPGAQPVYSWVADGFWISTTEVTQGQWEAVMGSNPSVFQGDKNLPVDSVSWYDCQRFIERLNQRLPGYNFRLPRNTEWEHAARAGSNALYYGGNSPKRLNEFAWYSGNSRGRTWPVAQKRPNAWGLYDTLGNVWEWVEDWYEPGGNKQTASAQGTLQIYKTLRGGAWSYYHDQCTLRAQLAGYPSAALDVYGFRIACDTIELNDDITPLPQ